MSFARLGGLPERGCRGQGRRSAAQLARGGEPDDNDERSDDQEDDERAGDNEEEADSHASLFHLAPKRISR